MNCKICTHSSEPFGRATLLGQYHARYFRCPACGFVQTEEPFWLEEAYARPINNSDIGLVARNLALARSTFAVIRLFFDPSARFLDYGGGYGLFVRLMRDRGLDFYRYERLCDNLFAQGWEGDVRDSYELVTALEVFEHFVQPRAEVERILQCSRSVLFSTLLIPDRIPRLGEWWYYGLEHGQHVALYTRAALDRLAKQFALNLYSDGKQLHLLSPRRLSEAVFRLALRRMTAAMLGWFLKRRSLLPQDYRRLTGLDLS